MKLSELIAATRYPYEDPEIILLRDWGELALAEILDPATLADGDPVLEVLAASEDAIVLVAGNTEEEED